jgi:hypothetical protein
MSSVYFFNRLPLIEFYFRNAAHAAGLKQKRLFPFLWKCVKLLQNFVKLRFCELFAMSLSPI